tara:strand:+ start:7896 stop:8462 length:567 start_codon:yes stop_codon:yes gene_type:complete
MFVSYNYISDKVILLLLSYFIINVFYSFYLKKIFILDILTVALGYVIRVLAGYHQLNMDYEFLLLTGIFLLSAIILLVKRKSEFNSSVYKKSLKLYNQEIINKIFYIFSFAILINYFLFIKIFLNTYDIFSSFLLVILSLLRLNFLLIYKKIKKNISIVLISDLKILVYFILWALIIFFKPFQNFYNF